ncbi:MAG: RNase adapter RapZ [Candidatus Nanopelagicales bacterium]
MNSDEFEVLIVTGMSGAGRSTAARALEDAGWFVVDNLPPSLLQATIDLLEPRTDVQRLAVVVDVRGGPLFSTLVSVAQALREAHANVGILFLEASEEVLVRRFESSRRPHPLQEDGTLLDALREERVMLQEFRAGADMVVDTSTRSVHDLRRVIEANYRGAGPATIRVSVLSFGFKYGIPVDADMIADVRFLPNPFWVPDLREQTGRDTEVSDYVLSREGALEVLEHYAGIVDLVAEGYVREGKRYVTIGIGCTGGKHRSVAMVERLARILTDHGHQVVVQHRDLGRE